MTAQPPEHRPGLTELPGAIIGALSSQPILLAIVVLNVITVGAIGYAALEIHKARTEFINQLVERCLPDKR